MKAIIVAAFVLVVSIGGATWVYQYRQVTYHSSPLHTSVERTKPEWADPVAAVMIGAGVAAFAVAGLRRR